MKGITLIELSVALCIVAILAAVLLPRMAELQRAVRVGDLRHLHGLLSTRVMLAHIAVQARQGRPDAGPCAGGAIADNQITGRGSVCTDRGLVALWHGYPAATATQRYGFGPEELPADRYALRTQGGKTLFMRTDARDPERCSFTYTQALDARTAAAISPPVVSGC